MQELLPQDNVHLTHIHGLVTRATRKTLWTYARPPQCLGLKMSTAVRCRREKSGSLEPDCNAWALVTATDDLSLPSGDKLHLCSLPGLEYIGMVIHASVDPSKPH